MYPNMSLLTLRKYLLYYKWYIPKEICQNLISCDIKYFPEDNSLIEAVVFVHLRLQREKLVASLQKNSY